MPVTVFSGHDFSDIDVETRPVSDRIQPRALKLHALLETPYMETLYLDTDTHVCHDFSEVFEVLSRFDVSMLTSQDSAPRPVDGVPQCYPEVNGGVIVYRNSVEMSDLLQAFAHNYDKLIGKFNGFDEPALRLSLWESDVRLTPLAPEYNFRVDSPSTANGIVKILHGKQLSQALAEEVNAQTGYRMYIPGKGIQILKK